jgi:hypothetical protein
MYNITCRVSMKLFGMIEVSGSELLGYVNAVYDHINKEKNSICFLLHATNVIIYEWYRSFKTKFNLERVSKIEEKLRTSVNDDEVRAFYDSISDYAMERVFLHYRTVINYPWSTRTK